jgi:DNA-binding XRE family transcriptional regulator
MNKNEFKSFRAMLDKTQKQMAQLLGTSLKAIHSYEQGWRTIPPAVERQLYFLVSRKRNSGPKSKPCWKIKGCPPERKKQCPAFEFKGGDLCWFINGTICDGCVHGSWQDKMKICRTCEVFAETF